MPDFLRWVLRRTTCRRGNQVSGGPRHPAPSQVDGAPALGTVSRALPCRGPAGISLVPPPLTWPLRPALRLRNISSVEIWVCPGGSQQRRAKDKVAGPCTAVVWPGWALGAELEGTAVSWGLLPHGPT